jgi:hypothetical protein
MKTEAVVHPANLGANDSPVDFVQQQGRAISKSVRFAIENDSYFQ